MSELSPELRKHYEKALTQKGGIEPVMTAAMLSASGAFGSFYLFSSLTYQIIGGLASLVAAFFVHKSARDDEVSRQKKVAEAMADDQLATAYGEHQKAVHHSKLLWTIIVLAASFGLLFTAQGNALLNIFLDGLRK
jgi:hypothetical protein